MLDNEKAPALPADVGREARASGLRASETNVCSLVGV